MVREIRSRWPEARPTRRPRTSGRDCDPTCWTRPSSYPAVAAAVAAVAPAWPAVRACSWRARHAEPT
eukprot:4470023-Prymnesium_polylepis.1